MSNSLLRFAGRTGIFLTCVFFALESVAFGDPTEHIQSVGADVIHISNVRLGLNGVWKVGYPARFAFDVTESSLPHGRLGESLVACIGTVDGEGVSVVYEIPMGPENTHSILVDDQKLRRFETTVVHGRSNRSIRIAIKSQQREKAFLLLSPSTDDAKGPAQPAADVIVVSDQQRGKILPAAQPWIIGIGSDLGLDQVAQQSAQGRLPSYVSTELDQAWMLPGDPEGYQGVDLVILPTSPAAIFESLNRKQLEALTAWVRRGGYLQVWAGESTTRISEWDWLDAMLPVMQQGVAPESDPGTIESFLSSQIRLGRLTLGKFKLRNGVVDLIDRTKYPLLVRGAYGLGQVQVFAADLNREPLKSWPDRKLLLEKMLVDSIESPRKIQTGSASQVAFLGYDDLSGQIRSYLDVFPSVENGNLLAMAAILGLLIALIGPLDYLVIQRAFQKPTWTWWSLGLWAMVGTAIVISMVNWWKPDRQLLNSVEIVDVDYSTQSLRGVALFSQYVGTAGNYHLTCSSRNLFASNRDGIPSVEPDKKHPVKLNWFGQPGAGLGGFDSSVRTDFGYAEYRVTDQSIDQLGIPTAGTKPLRAEWSTSNLPNWTESRFSILQGSDFLEGVWRNPMDEDLLDPILVYRGWIYRLQSKIRPREDISIAVNDIPKDLARYLQQRQSVKDGESSQPWDPTGGVSVERLVDMMGMYKAAGGLGYTGLAHRYLGKLDLSQIAYLNRAIVFGRLNEAIIDLSLKKGTEKMVNRSTNRSSFVRFILPVEIKHP